MLTPFLPHKFHTKPPRSLHEHSTTEHLFFLFEMMMEALNEDGILVVNKTYGASPKVADGEVDQVWNQQGHANGDTDMDSDSLDLIIRVASKLEKLFRCGTCDAYVLKQVEFERSSPDGILPMEMQMYQAFLSDD